MKVQNGKKGTDATNGQTAKQEIVLTYVGQSDGVGVAFGYDCLNTFVLMVINCIINWLLCTDNQFKITADFLPLLCKDVHTYIRMYMHCNRLINQLIDQIQCTCIATDG